MVIHLNIHDKQNIVNLEVVVPVPVPRYLCSVPQYPCSVSVPVPVPVPCFNAGNTSECSVGTDSCVSGEETEPQVINRPGVAGAVLQTPS